MKFNRVLLIGAPFLYSLVDEEILQTHAITPIYSYKKNSHVNQTKHGIVVFYETLSAENLSTIITETKPDAIVCYNDNFLIQTAKLRDQFSLHGIGSNEIGKFKLKSEMYKALEKNIPVPKTIKINTSTTLEEILTQLGDGPYFIKPDNLAGAEGTAYIPTLTELKNWFSSEHRHHGPYVMQKFYDLPLVHCELYVQDEVIVYIQARRYSYPNHKFLEGKIIASLPIADKHLSQLIEKQAEAVVKSLGYKNGVMHTEFFVDHNHSLIFLETNIRQAGGAINLIHKNRAGLSMETAMILLEFEKNLELKENYSKHEICGYIPIQQGKVIDIKFPRLKGEYYFDVRVKIGDICYQPTSASNTAIAFVGSSHSLEDLEEDFHCLESNNIIKYA
ncbi:MAG: hypothetical protein JO149_07360 [Gammaproteobacteria bacterium]|nr:hypothetical protein [Gammaproteobacteria bacterium]